VRRDVREKTQKRDVRMCNVCVCVSVCEIHSLKETRFVFIFYTAIPQPFRIAI